MLSAGRFVFLADVAEISKTLGSFTGVLIAFCLLGFEVAGLWVRACLSLRVGALRISVWG